MKPSLIAASNRLAIAILALALAATATAEEKDAALEAVRVKISAQFGSVKPENVTRSPVDGWFTIQQGSIIAFVSDDGRYLLQGDLIDLESQLNLTDQMRNSARRELVAGLATDQTIHFSPVDPKYSVTVFTDIDCTYCRKLHSQIDDYMAAGIEVRYLLYPRNGPASKAWSTSESVWCAKDRNLALTEAKLDREFESSPCQSSAVTNHYALGRDIGLSGTPAIVLDDGTLIGGYLPPEQLAARLQQNAAR